MPTIWQWNTKWMTPAERQFLPVEAPSTQIDRILVATGLIESRSEAQRLIKGGGVSWRRADDAMDWTKVSDFKESLEPGWPWYVRVGNGNWRMIARKDGRTGWDMSPSTVEVMVPVEGQTIEDWTEIWQ